jgi:uncharacterized protein (UPF0333 family)
MKVITKFNNPILSEKEYLDNEWQAEWTSNATGPVDGAESDAQFKKEMAEGEGEGEYWTAGGGSYLGVDGAEADAQFKKEMAEGEGEGEYWTAGGGSYLGVDGAESDAQFKKEMAEGEGEGEYWTAGGGSYLGADGVVDNFAAKVIEDGNLTVKTDNPVYEDTSMQAKQFMSNYDGFEMDASDFEMSAFIADEVDVDEEMGSDFLGSRANRRAKRAMRKGRRSKRGTAKRRSSGGRRSGGRRKRSGRVKEFFGKVGNFARDSGLLDYGRQQLDDRLNQRGDLDPGMDPGLGMDPSLTPPVTTKREGMSTTTKIAIGVGVVALLGVGGYYLMKNMKKGKGKK